MPIDGVKVCCYICGRYNLNKGICSKTKEETSEEKACSDFELYHLLRLKGYSYIPYMR